jgi:hypothetical protein
MKRLLLFASAILLSLAAAPALANDADRLPQPTPESYALAAQATLAPPPLLPSGSAGMTMLPAPIADAHAAGPLAASPGPQMRMASIGGVLSPGSAGAVSPQRQATGGETLGERLPSTPVALATLLLMICILIGRRNRPDRI